MLGWFILLGIVILAIIVMFVWLAILSYNIPVVVLRFTGHKGRPLMMIKKAKKRFVKGIPLLFVRGYKHPVSDFKSENYYPSVRGPYGGLILWEFEDNMLTPAITKKNLKEWSPEKLELVKKGLAEFNSGLSVPFEFDEALHKQLKLKAVDDVDMETFMQEISRIDGQYSGGFKDFLMKYGGHINVIIIAVLLLVGLILWFQNMPDFAAQCYGAAQQATQQSLVERGVDAVRPGG
jgi:hypothetical protein